MTNSGVVVEAKKHTLFRQSKIELSEFPDKPPRNWLLLIGVGLLIVIVGVLAYGLYWYASSFERSSGADVLTLLSSLKEGRDIDPFESSEYVHFLVIGLDKVENRHDESLLTDTIMLVSVNRSGDVSLFSIPRDLWIDSLKTKINALYYYGEDSEDMTGKELLSTVVSDITGVDINYSAVFTIETVERLIDTLGGISVDVNRSFMDERFPRDDVDISSDDPEILYETLRFVAGNNNFDGEMALKFMRSRNSNDEIEGTDVGRTMRQQLIVKSIVDRLANTQMWRDPIRIGAIYRIWKEMIDTDLSDEVVVGMLLHMDDFSFDIRSLIIPVSEGESRGIVTIPPISKYRQWVYEPEDPSWSEMKEWLAEELY